MIGKDKKFKILLIGDSCTDEYFIGSCDRLSPEAPIPVIKILEHYTLPGMASNVKKNFEVLGQDINFITNDSEIKKTRYIDKRSGQHLLRVDHEPKITSWSGKSKINNDYDALVISDYDKGFLTYEQIEKLIKKSKKPVFIDTKKTDLSRFEGAFVKINEHEYERTVSINSNLIVTLGHKGAVYKSDKEKQFPAPKVEVADVCGAGDTFLTFLTYGYLLYRNIDLAIKLAIKASSISVKYRGNYAPTIGEVLNDQ